jgi:transcriptional regulator with XRE-family HTH domain
MIESPLKSIPSDIGRVLRVVRERTGRNQGEIARTAGISISMLSQIERGVVSPSIETLLNVCAGLDLDAAELFKRLSPRDPLKLTHRGRRLSTESKGIRYEQLAASADASFPVEMFLMEVAPGSSVGMSDRGHEGVELGYVIEGEAVVIVDNKEYAVAAGDTVSFSAHLPHRLENRGDQLFRAVWTAAPPHKDYFDMQEK